MSPQSSHTHTHVRLHRTHIPGLRPVASAACNASLRSVYACRGMPEIWLYCTCFVWSGAPQACMWAVANMCAQSSPLSGKLALLPVHQACLRVHYYTRGSATAATSFCSEIQIIQNERADELDKFLEFV